MASAKLVERRLRIERQQRIDQRLQQKRVELQCNQLEDSFW